MFAAFSAAASVEQHFETLKQNPGALYSFLKAMPKGGELHYHLAGGAYPEQMLKWAATKDYCLNLNDFSMSPGIEENCNLSSAALLSQSAAYADTVRAWSMKDFVPGKISGHDKFFETFDKFLPVVADFRSELLADVLQEAASQNKLYMEIMILPDNAASTAYGKQIAALPSLEAKQKALLSNQGFRDNIRYTVQESQDILKRSRKLLACDTSPQSKVCQIKVKFQYYILREQDANKVFAQALNAFQAVKKSPALVGVNLVQAEDGVISLRDYHRQMDIFNYLHRQYPDVHISLHAGELAPGSTSPSDQTFHINEAVKLGHAERIGHGVDISHEKNAEKLLELMAKRPVPVEINLISNQKILGISGSKHPLKTYLASGVPVVFSTDDEGILRTDLTEQYVDAALVQKLSYQQLKQINRNSLSYAFIEGKSLWTDKQSQKITPACKNLDSPACLAYIQTSPKATLQWKLEKELASFEAGYS